MNISVLLFYHKNIFEKEYNAKKKPTITSKIILPIYKCLQKTINKNIL